MSSQGIDIMSLFFFVISIRVILESLKAQTESISSADNPEMSINLVEGLLNGGQGLIRTNECLPSIFESIFRVSSMIQPSFSTTLLTEKLVIDLKVYGGFSIVNPFV